MRKNRIGKEQNDFSMLALDDDEMMTITLQSYFTTSGYKVDIENDPVTAIERVRNGSYDILLLDFLMAPLRGDEVVARIREFDSDLYIILLTGHKSLAPPIKTIRELDIQGYYEKSDRFDQLELLVESCVKSIKQMRTIHTYRNGLKDIVDEMPALYAMQQPGSLMRALLLNMQGILGLQDCFIYMDPSILREDFKGGLGGAEDSDYFEGTGSLADGMERVRACYLGMADSDTAVQAASRQGELLVFPLVSTSGKVFGIVGTLLGEDMEPEKFPLFEIYARQASSAMSNMLLRFLLNAKNQELERAYASLRDSYIEMISALRLAVDTKDIYTRGHSDRVSYYAQCIAKAAGKDEDFCERVRIAGLFHDVGKIGIRDDILLKPSRLTEEEYNEVKAHPTNSKRIISAITVFGDIAGIVEDHHERIDGKGYPNGKKGREILEEARIISIADAFDAMTSHRHYRDNMSFERAVGQLKEYRGTQFDPEFVDIFLEVLKDYERMRQKMAWTYQ